MSIWQAVILGLVQGLGEFLPVSSSAHLVLVPWLFGWRDYGLTFDVALHLGTLVAVLIYFWKDWMRLISGAIKGSGNSEGRLFWYLVLACVPGAVFGFLLEHKAETSFRSPVLVALMLIIMGVFLLWADARGAKRVSMNRMGGWRSLVIGFSQALAIIPGVSRSGVTMTAGLFSGLTREAAARFSFLLSAPIILGAGLVKIPDLLHQPGSIDLPFIVGIVVSALSGLVAIGFLLRYIETRDFRPFAWYRFALGFLVLVVVFFRG